MKTICFTGRRPKDLCGYNWDNYKQFGHDLTEYLDTLYTFYGVRRFISGGAQGFDQIAFWAVFKLSKRHPDIENIVYVPFEGQENKWAENGPFSKSEYASLRKAATATKVLVENVYQTSEYAKCLLSRNEHMVDDSDAVVALYPDDSWETTTRGGTSYTMRYAYGTGKTILQIKYEISQNQLSFGKAEIIGGKRNG